ncbi:MAG: helix-turn-helix domain-containing protein [Candidatus Ruminococcus intestinipullorum]|nr:helix-turn-helix domain-containing protein [Candidatus Ruminococcus intestinipullorum]
MKNRIEELRKQHGLKQEELANILEVSRQTIGSLERCYLLVHRWK